MVVNKIQLFGSLNTVRKGWLTTIHKDISLIFTDSYISNYNKEKYEKWLDPNVDYSQLVDYEGGRYIGTTPEIELLRPKALTI